MLLSTNQKSVWGFTHTNPWIYPELPKPTKQKFDSIGEQRIIKVQAGDGSAAFLSADGRIITWNGYYAEYSTIEIDEKFVDISMGVRDWSDSLLALTDDNRLFAFGNNYFGQCGQGSTTQEYISPPVEVKNTRNLRIKQISTGSTHCLIKCAKI